MGFSCCSGFYFCVVFCESLFVFFSRLAIVLPYLLSVGHCTALPHLGWPLYCLNLLNLPLLRSLFVLFSRLDIVLPYLPQLTTSDIIICFNLSVGHVLPYLLSVGHCTGLPSSTYHFWLCLWYLQTFLSGKYFINTWTTCLDFWSCRCSSMAFFNFSFYVLTCSDGMVLCVASRLP